MFKDKIRANIFLKNVYAVFRLFVFEFRISHLRNIIWFVRDYRCLADEQNEAFKNFRLYPCLDDKTRMTPLEPTYFFQDTWAAKKVFQKKPCHHVDIGSSAMTMGIISQFVPTTMVDIRPLPLTIEGLQFQKGSILALPFKEDSIESISSLCVVEHIGLGRYGDPIDAFGSEKAAKELQRVLKKGGDLYFSVPVDSECRVYFNAHRAFTRQYVMDLFSKLSLVEEKYHYGTQLYDQYDRAKGFGTGLFHFTKN